MAESDVEIWYEDEVHFQRHGTLTRMWAPRGKQPGVIVAPTRQNVGYFGMVCPATGESFIRLGHPFNSETVMQFFREFLESRAQAKTSTKQIVVILDNASWHKKAVRLMTGDDSKQLVFLFLPPYSPDLNPIERLWRWTRRHCTHNKYFDHIDALADTLNKFFSLWELPNSELRSLCATN